jgi:alginate O-acetyltransferase complex protein AlgJ
MLPPSRGDQPLPAGGKIREELARNDLERTIVSPTVARSTLMFFLFAIAAVPVAEWVTIRLGQAQGIASAWLNLFNLPDEIRASRVAPIAPADPGAWQRLVTANRMAMAGMATFQRALEDEAVIARTLRPPTQALMTDWLGAGNERVYPGRGGWLFYRPDVEYVTGRGFLDRTEIRRRIADTPQWTRPPQPDPRPAIVQLKRDLDARGITLIVLPTPPKPGVHPEMLARDAASSGEILHNLSYGAFLQDLQREGVLVLDPSQLLADARRSGPQYLATDTHWLPEAMEAIVDLVADAINRQVPPTLVSQSAYRVERTEVQNLGDTARMLDLPAGSTMYPREAVWIRRILQPDGSLWRSSRDAEVLVLGDSFTNIYSLESMGWGTSAGFAEQLSYVLGEPVDRLVQNDNGAYAPRDMLMRDPDRLKGKRVVVYQFAARELSFGDWKMLPMPRRQ